MLGEFADRPDPVRIGRGEGFQRGTHRLGFDVAQLVVGLEAREIDAGPAREQRQRRLGVGIATIFGVLIARFGFGAPGDHGGQREDQEVGRIAAIRGGAAAQIGNLPRDDLRGWAVDEDAFGVRRCERAPTVRGTGLVEHRGALR